MPDYTSCYVNADGIKTHYLESGNRNRPPVVLIHGGGAGADAMGNWRHVMPQLAQDFYIVAPDMVGFGKTEKPCTDGYRYSQSARNDHLASFIKALGLNTPALVGNSMGGATALGVAMAHPEMVGKLVLMGSAGLNSEITEELKPIIYYDFTRDGMRRLIKALTGSRFIITDDLVDFRYKMSIDPDTRRAYEKVMACIREDGGLAYKEDDIARVKTPTLVVNGKQDLVVPLKNAYRFLELLDNSWGYFIPHCGHWAMIEAADDFTHITRAFLLSEGGV
ncbi:MAG: alpha/beta hydrolase [Sphingomonadales bacterium]|nr:alpha/beta hydrolase [Sphingomonadales bacterium]